MCIRIPSHPSAKFSVRPLCLALAAALSLPLVNAPARAANLLVGSGGNGGAADLTTNLIGGGGGGGIGGGGGGGTYNRAGDQGGGGVVSGPGGASSAGAWANGGNGAYGGIGGAGNGGTFGANGPAVVDASGAPSGGTAPGAGAVVPSSGTINGSSITTPLGTYDYVGIGGGGGGAGGVNQVGGAGSNGSLFLSSGTLLVNQAMFIGGAGGGGSGNAFFSTRGGAGGAGLVNMDNVRLFVGGSLLVGGANGLGTGGLGGDGTLTLTNASELFVGVNNASGGLELGGGANGGAGVLNLSDSTLTLLATNAGLTIRSNGTLNVGNATPAAAAGGTIVGFLPINNDGQINFNQSNAVYEFSRRISGSGSVAINGAGTTRLTGDNTYTGGTTIAAGSTLEIGSGVAGSVMGNITNQGVVNFSRTDNRVYAGSITGGGMLGKTQTSILTLTGNNPMSGNILVYGGTLALSGVGARLGSSTSSLDAGFGASSGVTVSSGAVLTTLTAMLGGTAGGSALGSATVQGVGSGWNTETLVLGLQSRGSLDVLSGGRVTATNALLATTGTGSSTVALSGAVSSFSVSNTLDLGAAGSAVVSVANGATLTAGKIRFGTSGGNGHLEVTGTPLDGIGYVSADEITKAPGAGTSSIRFDGGGVRARSALPLFGGFSAGEVAVGDGGMFIDNNGVSDLHISTPLSGTGTVTLLGSGSVSYTQPNTNTGGNTVSAGTLTAWTQNTLGSGALTVHSGASVTLNGSQNVGAISGAGAISGISGVSLRAGSDNSSTVFSGGMSGTLSLIKQGAGTLTLSGTNAYTGSTTIEAGKLLVTGSAANSSVTVGASGTLAGTGRVGGVTVAAGGVLNPGNPTGSLRVAGPLNLNAGGTLVYGLGSPGATPSAGTSSHLDVTGDVTLNGGLTLLDPGLTAGPGYYRLISYGGNLLANNLAAPAAFANQPVSVVDTLPGFIDLRLGSTGSDQLQTWSGGSGTWSDAATLWNNESGSIPAAWAGKTAVFNTAGGGTILVNGTQSFDGLQFVADGYRLESDVHGNGTLGGLDTRAGGSEIRVLAGVTAEIDAVISGAGGIDKTQGGTLVLSGPNIYGGETRLSGGTLSVGGDSSLGTAGGLRFQGGVLRITGNQFGSTARAINWSAQGGGFDIDDPTHTFTVGQNLVGAGDLVKRGAGTLVLSGANSYGNTRVEAGTLVGNAQSVSGNLLNDGKVVFDQDTDASYAGGITGAGSVVKQGLGTLLLTAAGSQQQWRVETGALAVSANGFAGNADVASGAALRFDASADGAYADQLSGAGALNKTGAGKLSLTGDSSGFAGHTDVTAGTLAVGIAGAGKLGGTLTIGNGATLQGTGQVGATTLMNGATIAPGNSIGTLSVAGDLSFSPGSVYVVEANPGSDASDRIDVSGTARLAGSVVHVGPEGGFAATRQYTILTAGQVLGQFAAVSSNYAYLDPKLDYAQQAVTLQLSRKQVETPEPNTPRPIAFADAANTGNQRATANALDSLPAGNPLHDYILTLPAGAPPAVFDNLSGEAHAGIAGALMGMGSTVRTLPLNRLRANLNAGMRAGAPTAQAGTGPAPASALPASNALPAWAELVGNWQTIAATSNNAEVRQRITGVFVGTDQPVGNGWRLGGALGYTDGNSRVDDRASQADVSSYSAALYGGKSFEAGRGKLNVMAGAAYTWHDIDSERSASVAGITEKLTARYGASTAQVFTELGYEIAVSDRISVEPFAGVSYSDVRTRGFSESGGLAALRGRSASQDQVASTLGVRGRSTFKVGDTEGTLRGSAGWRHAFGDITPRATMAFDGSQAFTVTGAPIARDAAVVEVGADVAISRSATLGLSYSGQYGDGSREHAGSLDVRWRF